MTGIANFLRNYEFLNFHKSVNEAQAAVYKLPSETWGQIGNKFYNTCWHNGTAIAAIGADVGMYLTVSALRTCGLFRPLPPSPPTFPTPYDNVQFIQYAIERALWNWDLSAQKEIREEIESSFGEKWNVFQVVGEWSIAYSFENANKSDYYKPTFLTISEPLENGHCYQSIMKEFHRLWAKDQKAILEALYTQTPPASLSYWGKPVYQDIRSLASKFHQGNANYLNAFSEYTKMQERPVPSAPPLAALRSVAPTPSAPPLSALRAMNINEAPILKNVEFLRNACLNGQQNLPALQKNQLVRFITTDQTRSAPTFVAQLCMLRVFREGYRHNHFHEVPNFISYDAALQNGKGMRSAGMDFAVLNDQDFLLLEERIHGKSVFLPVHLQMRLAELSEFAALLQNNREFLQAFEALRIDLLAD